MSAAGPLGAAARLATGRAARGGAVVLCYHDVVLGPGDRGAELDLNVTAGQLRQHLLLLRRLGYRVVPLGEITARVLAGRPTAGLAAVTFDDALAGVHHHGLPVLLELGVPATLFTVSTLWGSPPPWWEGSGPTMTRRQLEECRAHGLELAAHTRTHASLPTLTRPGVVDGAARLREEVSGSRAEIEQLVGHPVEVFAYPFGHHDERVRDAVREAGFTAAYTFLNGRVEGAEDPLRLPRFTMGRHHDRVRLAYHLARPPGSWPDHQLPVVTGGDGG